MRAGTEYLGGGRGVRGGRHGGMVLRWEIRRWVFQSKRLVGGDKMTAGSIPRIYIYLSDLSTCRPWWSTVKRDRTYFKTSHFLGALTLSFPQKYGSFGELLRGLLAPMLTSRIRAMCT